MQDVNQILCPLDFSDATALSVEVAASIAKAHDSTLHLVHVERSPYTFSPGIGGNFPDPSDPESHLLFSISSNDCRVQHALLLGDPASEIVRYAQENDIDQIVMGTSGQAGVAHVLFGSVAEAVVRRAPMPVLTVRPSAKAEQLVRDRETEYEQLDRTAT